MGIAMKLTILFSYGLMITLNALANILPINGLGTGQISDAYPNLFAPAGITFSIWGIIYLLLGVYVISRFGYQTQLGDPQKENALKKVSIAFIVSSVANALWIIAWHYLSFFVSLLLMLLILMCLMTASIALNKIKLSSIEWWTIKLPFSVYFGWITVATIANVTTLLVSLDWSGFGISNQVWMIMILIIGALIGIITIYRQKDIPYGMVIIWAYGGILLKHLSETGFSREYPLVIATVGFCIVVILGALLKVFNRLRQVT